MSALCTLLILAGEGGASSDSAYTLVAVIRRVALSRATLFTRQLKLAVDVA